ncbi:thioesterase II family protein [Oxalobacteraceae bacterium A2-2]
MSDWFIKLQHTRQARLRLFFFHYAGGGASIFRGWEKHFPREIDVFAVQSPGRENRYSAAPIACLETKVAALRQEIAPYLDLPAIFVGHSMGAMLAFELARALQAQGQGRLAHVVLSAARAMHLPRVKPLMAGLSHEDFIREIKMYSRTPHEILDNRDIMEVFMPMLRADFTLSESRVFDPEPRLAAPVTIFSGREDDAVPFADARAWNRLVTPAPAYVDFDGGHFFIHGDSARFIGEVQAVARRVLEQAHGAEPAPLAA